MRGLILLAALWLLASLTASAAGTSISESDAGTSPTAEQKSALAEMEAKIVKLKAEGKLPDKLPETSATSTSTSTATSAPSGCTRLAVGASAIVDYTFETSPTGTSARYGLSRPKDSTYLAELNLEFERGEGFPDDLTPKELNGKYRKRVADCLNEYENSLKNERAGKSLILRLTDNAAVPVSQISVVAPGKRANAAAYPSDISCPVILHELMHLLGLADEYSDTSELHEPLADCRPATAADSLMNSQLEAVLGISMSMEFQVQMCKCDVKGSACWALSQKNELSGKTCPPGTTPFFRDLDPGMKTSFNVFDSSEAF
ncbi:MAG: hypothetical protein ACXVCS_16645, partial [Bdellovibrionota bacterium]